MLRWLLLIPFAVLCAMTGGLVALLVASVASPELSLLIGGGFERLIDVLFADVFADLDPASTVEAAFLLLRRLALAILVVPIVLVAIGCELFRIRDGLIQIGVTGVLAALLPLAMLRLSRAPTAGEVRIMIALFLVGATTGLVYWLIAGRGAGGASRRPVSAPPPGA